MISTQSQSRFASLGAAASLCFALCFASVASAQVKPSALFSDHMVLQSGHVRAHLGHCRPGEKITVTLNGQTNPQSPTCRASGRSASPTSRPAARLR